MAILTPGALVSSIHGSVGSSNFYKHGPWQVLRHKGLPKSSTSAERAKVLSCWSRAYADAKTRYASSIKLRTDLAASRLTLTKYGIPYNLSGFKLLVSCNFIGLYHLGHVANVTGDFRGMISCIPFTISLQDTPGYIRITIHYFTELIPQIVFSWQYPQNGFSHSKMSDFPFTFIQTVLIPGNYDIPAGTYPRTTGKTTLWYRVRTINAYGEFSPSFIGYCTKWNWQ